MYFALPKIKIYNTLLYFSFILIFFSSLDVWPVLKKIFLEGI